MSDEKDEGKGRQKYVTGKPQVGAPGLTEIPAQSPKTQPPKEDQKPKQEEK